MNAVFLIFLLLIAILVLIYPYQKKIQPIQGAIALLILIFVPTGYWYFGSWQSLSKYKQQEVLLKSVKNPQQLIEKLKQHLKKDPSSARGWFLLGRLYASQSQWSEARDSFERSHSLEPDNEQTTVNYVQSLWQINHQVLNAKIKKLLESILKKNPQQPDAISILAIDAYRSHDYQKAIDYWSLLLKQVSPDSVDAKAIRQAIVKAKKM